MKNIWNIFMENENFHLASKGCSEFSLQKPFD